VAHAGTFLRAHSLLVEPVFAELAAVNATPVEGGLPEDRDVAYIHSGHDHGCREIGALGFLTIHLVHLFSRLFIARVRSDIPLHPVAVVISIGRRISPGK